MKMWIHSFFHRKYLNPVTRFTHEATDENTFARTDRTSFSQKFLDTIALFAGTTHSYGSLKKSKAGLLDWGMLHIPALITLLKVGAREQTRKLPFLFKLCMFIPYIALSLIETALTIAKMLVAILISLVAAVTFLPLIQGMSYLRSHSRWNALEIFLATKFHGIYMDKIIENQEIVTDLNENYDIYQLSDFKKNDSKCCACCSTIKKLENKANDAFNNQIIFKSTENEDVHIDVKWNKEFFNATTAHKIKSNLFFFNLGNINDPEALETSTLKN